MPIARIPKSSIRVREDPRPIPHWIPACLERAAASQLATLSFVADGEYLLFPGPPEVARTHLAPPSGTTAIQQITSVSFATMIDLQDQVRRDAKEDRLDQGAQTLCRPKLLTLVEMGECPLARMVPTPCVSS